MGLSRQEYWSGLPFPPPGDLPDPGIKLASLGAPALQADFFFFLQLSHWGNSAFLHTLLNSIQIKINLSDFQ